MVALMAAGLFVIAGMVVDLGHGRDVRRQSQIASDAAALVAANMLYPGSARCALPAGAIPPCYTDAINAAKSYAAVNFAVDLSAWTSCTDAQRFYVPPSESQCISFTDDSLGSTQPARPNRVRVRMPTNEVTAGLGRLAGVATIPISTSARAALLPGQARSCGLCVLGPGVSQLGNSDVTVDGGSVFANGSIDSGPNGELDAAPVPPNTITMVGTCTGQCNPAPRTGAPPLPDPYASVVALPIAKGTLVAGTNPCMQGPGIYGALTLSGTCNLAPGLYFLTGIWNMQNTSTLLKGTGVTLYATCGTTAAPAGCALTGQAGGGLDGKNGDTQIVAPTSSPGNGVPPGLAVIYDRGNTSPLNLQGNGYSSITGAVYAAKATLEFTGTSSFTVTNGPVIVGALHGNGNNGGIHLLSTNAAGFPGPPSGATLDQ